jgi:hypothetical protein
MGIEKRRLGGREEERGRRTKGLKWEKEREHGKIR